jgi:hypothetical protein
VFTAESDPGRPLAGVHVLHRGKIAAKTAADGTASLQITGQEGETFDFDARCPAGYRSPEVNKAIGGSATSDHTRGMAADFEVIGVPNKVVAEWVRDNCKFRQLILEFPGANPNDGWVHVAYNKDDLKGQVLTAKKINGKTQYLPGLV